MYDSDTAMEAVLARLAAQEARLATQGAELARLRQARRRRSPTVALVLALLVALAPLALLAAPPFADLNAPDRGHNANIALIAGAGITRGCNPPANDRYCPNDAVTREQMATFLARTAGLGPHPPVANAATLGGYTADGLVRAGLGYSTNANGTTATALRSDPLAVVSLDLAVPAAGFVLVTGVTTVRSGALGCPCLAGARLRELGPGGATSPPVYATVGRGEANANDDRLTYNTLAATFVFAAGSAGTRGFALEAFAGPAGPVEAFYPAITALFVPFGAGGQGATGMETAPLPDLQFPPLPRSP